VKLLLIDDRRGRAFLVARASRRLGHDVHLTTAVADGVDAAAPGAESSTRPS
jgi:hypothetical protein